MRGRLVLVVLLAAVAMVAVKGIKTQTTNDAWRSLAHIDNPDRAVWQGDLDKTPPQATVLPALHPDWGEMRFPASDGSGRSLGINSPVTNLIMYAYGVRNTHILFTDPAPEGKYDYIVNLPTGSQEAFKRMIKEHFGLVAHLAVTNTTVWILQTSDPDNLKMCATRSGQASQNLGEGQMMLEDSTTANLASALEGWILIAPVLDRTGVTGRYDFNLHWDVHDRANRISTFTEQLEQDGLKLFSTNLPMEMLVVEKVGK